MALTVLLWAGLPIRKPLVDASEEKKLAIYLVVSKSFLIFGEPKRTNMKHKFKIGDYVFHHNDEDGTLGCIVERIGRGDRIKVTDRGWVSARKCQLQEEWRKENEA